MMIYLIAAVADNGVIGKDGSIPWNIPEDRRFFRETTMGGVLVMGKNTYESIGRPLYGRKTVVVTSKGIDIPPKYADTLYTAEGIDEAIALAKNLSADGRDDAGIYICGGASIYKEALAVADVLYITRIELSIDGDTYFPTDIGADFALIQRRRLSANCTLMVYSRK